MKKAWILLFGGLFLYAALQQDNSTYLIMGQGIRLLGVILSLLAASAVVLFIWHIWRLKALFLGPADLGSKTELFSQHILHVGSIKKYYAVSAMMLFVIFTFFDGAPTWLLVLMLGVTLYYLIEGLEHFVPYLRWSFTRH